MIASRIPVRDDIPAILNIYKQNPSYDLDIFKNTIKDQVITYNEELVAYGVLKHFAEAVMVMDHSRPKSVQVVAFKKLMDQAIEKCKELQVQDLHIFTEDMSFADILINKFDFFKVNGIALLRRV